MRKRFLNPVWKFEEIEKELNALEESGWRLERIRGLRCFEFVKSKPKNVQYFFTYSLTRENLNMQLIENTLIQKYSANPVKGDFSKGIGGIKVFRITKPIDLSEQKLNRDIILHHNLFKEFILGVLMLFLPLLPLIMGIIFGAEKSLRDTNVFTAILLGVYFVLAVSYLIYSTVGFIYQKNKLAKME